MRKSDLFNNRTFKEADADLPIKYVQTDGKEFSLGKITLSRMIRKIYWEASCSAISKRDLLANFAFCSARNDAEILIEFADYRRETWQCDVEIKDGFITIKECP